MSKQKLFALCGLAGAVGLLVWPRAQPDGFVYAAEAQPGAFLIRFGLDGAKDTDWSGEIQPAPMRSSGWQFDSADQVESGRWKCVTREQRYWDTPYERNMGPTSNKNKVTGKGVYVELDRNAAAPFDVRTAQGSFRFESAAIVMGQPRRFLDGRVEVMAVPAIARITSGPDAEDDPSLLTAKDGALWLAYIAFNGQGDQVFVRRLVGGRWTEPEAITSGGRDCFRTALAEDGSGRIWAVWSEQTQGNFDLHARVHDGKRWSAAEKLTNASASDIYHAMTTDRAGRVHVAWQSARAGNFDIFVKTHDGRQWRQDQRVSESSANDWQPALAPAPDGSVAILWDSYEHGNYDIFARQLRNGKLEPVRRITTGPAFEARVSAQYDQRGRLWMAWEEGDSNWGKDYGAGIVENGRGLMVRRQTRIGVLSGAGLEEPEPRIVDAVPGEYQQAMVQPRLILDGGGNPWVFFRYRVNLPQQRGGGEGASRAMWRLAATGLQNGKWIPMIEFPDGFGRIDAPVFAATARDGGLLAVWAGDGRLWPVGTPGPQDLRTAAIPKSAVGTEARLVAFSSKQEPLPASHNNEAADVARVRGYRVSVGGKRYQIARGDVHRHTDISWDGNRDGSLHDSYRYALDAAAMDYIGVCDHQAGGMIPYNWWMIQKAADLFTIPGRFAPLYSYERSLPFPNGHRNVLFADRGRPVLAIAEAERRGTEGAAKLYEYLKRFGGITSSHTSATGAGTDWRDSHSELEPVVEIYQGYRRNYEGPGAPRAPGEREETRFTAGFVWNAWAKGIKLGVQSSSDHVSTHISYAAFYVDSLDRHAILRAAKARRAFAATDNIIIDFRIGDHFMGESFTSSGPLQLEARVIGTAPVPRVVLIKNNQVIYTTPGTGTQTQFTYTDHDARAGESYYYVRAEQQDGQLGWSSPIWATLKP